MANNRMKFQLIVLLIASCLLSGWVFSFTRQQQARRRSNSFTASPGRPFSLNSWQLYSSFFRDDDEEEDDDDEIDADSLGDWRAFRRNLAAGMKKDGGDGSPSSKTKKGSAENEKVLRSQNEILANEYKTGVWAHETSTPEVGGIVCRMPLEVEIYRNFKHSLIGKKLRSKLQEGETSGEWFQSAQTLVETSMQDIAENAQGGQIDAATLDDEAAEMLQLYIDNQESWQEVCLVLNRNVETGKSTTIVLNRPMAMKLTENLARLVLNGAFASTSPKNKSDLVKFVLAFGNECAVYVGGSQGQEEPAIMLHGIANLPGAVEISKGSGIYRGGLEAAVNGVLEGKYKPLDFRFFVGRHDYDESMLDVQVLLGKYQPIACARSLALKQCISLPKPLWHEVLELCGGELKEISGLEMLKRDDLTFEIVDEDDDEDMDELDIEAYDDDDEEEYYA